MGNPYKIKRHDRIYRRSAKSVVIRVVVVVVTIAILFGLGWTLYGPVMDFVKEQSGKTSPDANPPGISTEPQEDQTADATEQLPAEVPEETTPDVAPATVSLAKTAYLAPATVSNPAAFSSALASLKGKGYDSVMVELKQIDGTVSYPISYKAEIDERYTAATTFELSSIVSQIQGEGLKPVAMIHTFRDHLYPSADKSSSTMYQGGDFLWFDDSPQNGGKPWLNPFSDSAKAYINKIVDDAISAGFQNIVLDSVQFPQGYALDQIEYGEFASTDKQQYLRQYIAGMTAYASGKGAALTAALPATTLLGGSDEQYYGGDATQLVGETVVLNLSPSLFGASFETDQVSIPTPQADPYNAIKTAASAVKGKLPTAQITALLDGTGLTDAVIESEIKALAESGITSYIVENPPM